VCIHPPNLQTPYLHPQHLPTSYLHPTYILPTSYLRTYLHTYSTCLHPTYILPTYLQHLPTSYLHPTYIPTAPAYILPTSYLHPQHLHLTLAMLKLYSDESRFKARTLLKELRPKIVELLDKQPLQVCVCLILGQLL
jgi:hypothetical protein